LFCEIHDCQSAKFCRLLCLGFSILKISDEDEDSVLEFLSKV
jgi:hypothetical protein